jgi:deoxyinosine 3'endonuclease (endonuclease V)
MKSSWLIEQNRLKSKVILEDSIDFNKVKFVGGMDISYVNGSDEALTAYIIFSFPEMEIIKEDYIFTKMTEPYVSGFLAFREIPSMMKLINRTEIIPDVIFVDGNGILHKNRFGLACHLGVLTNIPTIGVGKNLYCVDGITRDSLKVKTKELLTKAKTSFRLVGDSGEIWGEAARISEGSKNPIFISPGHLISLDTSVSLTFLCSKGYRIPEPTRIADIKSREILRVNQLKN